MGSFIASMFFKHLRIFVLDYKMSSKIRLCHCLKRVSRIPDLHPIL